MLGSLRGSVLATLESKTLIDVAGVGYWVFTGAWHPVGEVLTYLHHVVREDTSDLYGFETLGGLQLFEQLISVSGIGPKAALAVLALGSSEVVSGAIARQDTGFLTAASGVGTKAAQKIVLELHQKVASVPLTDLGAFPQQELRLALESLGYRPHEINGIITQLPDELTSLDTQITWSLHQLSR